MVLLAERWIPLGLAIGGLVLLGIAFALLMRSRHQEAAGAVRPGTPARRAPTELASPSRA
jgi:hypothetical protein